MNAGNATPWAMCQPMSRIVASSLLVCGTPDAMSASRYATPTPPSASATLVVVLSRVLQRDEFVTDLLAELGRAEFPRSSHHPGRVQRHVVLAAGRPHTHRDAERRRPYL